MDLKQKEVFEIAEKIILRNKITLDNFHKYADKKKHNDIGIEGWLQLELISKLTEMGIYVDHRSNDADLHFEDREDIELRATTTFHPSFIFDGLSDHKSQAPVLFFSGYNKNKQYKIINKPLFEDPKYIFDCFINYFNNKRAVLNSKSIALEYKIIQLEKPCILGLLSRSDKPSHDLIK